MVLSGTLVPRFQCFHPHDLRAAICADEDGRSPAMQLQIVGADQRRVFGPTDGASTESYFWFWVSHPGRGETQKPGVAFTTYAKD
jgi:hypothetical protein